MGRGGVCFQGLDDENQERGQLLGAYTYDQDGDAVQTFAVTVSNRDSCKHGTFKEG